MYGLVHRAIHDLVNERFGPEAWERVRSAAQVDEGHFVAMQAYDDAITYRLVGAASEVLELPGEAILEAFGEYWTIYTIEEGYKDLLDMMGSTLEAFLENLDSMHSRIAMAMPELVPPSFEREAQADGSSILYYRSTRTGLAPMVLGLLKGLGTRFELELDVTHLPPTEDGVERFQITAA